MIIRSIKRNRKANIDEFLFEFGSNAFLGGKFKPVSEE